jgi:hypothetical protein
VAAYRTVESASVTGNVDEELLDVLPKSLRFICHNGESRHTTTKAACDSTQRPRLLFWVLYSIQPLTETRRLGAGYDSINVSACTARGIRVSNTPTAVDDATADITIWLLLGALRNLPVSMATLRAGTWRGKTPPALGHDPQGKVLGPVPLFSRIPNHHLTSRQVFWVWAA